MSRFLLFGFIGLIAVLVFAATRQQYIVVQAQAPSGTLGFDPAQGRIDTTSSLSVTVVAETSAQEKINIARLSILYPPELVHITQCSAGEGYQGIAGQSTCRSANGQVTVDVQSVNMEGKNGSVVLATLQFESLVEGGSAQISFGQQEIVVKRSDGTSALLAIGTTGTGTYQLGGMTLDPSPTPVSSSGIAIGTMTTLTINIGPGSPSPTIRPGDSSIAIGTTNTLTITIGGTVTPTSVPTSAPRSPTPIPTIAIPPDTPYIRFGVSLFAVERTPEITVRVRLTDLIARLTPPVNSPPAILSSCDAAGIGEHLFTEIPMVADGSGTYYPKAWSTVTTIYGTFPITAGGWIPLVGARINRPYSMTVKAEKHRAHRLIHQITLDAGTPPSQDLDLSSIPLEPGDLPDPNHNLFQDCIVNSIDLSLIISRIGYTDAQSLQIADVNYDSIVNGNDISKVVHTLSTKPDDDP